MQIMKTNILNQLLALRFNKMNYRIFNNSVLLKNLFLFVVLFSFENNIAQNTNQQSLKEVSSFLSSLKSDSDYQKTENLINGPNSAIYLKNNTVKVFGENCKVLFSDIASLDYIKNNPLPSNNVEIVRINLKESTDLNGKIDLSLFSDFPNLKYIYIVSGLNITKQNIANMILNNDEKYSILYKIEQAE